MKASEREPGWVREWGTPDVPKAQVMDKAMELALKMASKAPEVMRLGRQSWMRANDLDYRRNVENQIETMCNIMETPAAVEGMFATFGREKDRPIPVNR